MRAAFGAAVCGVLTLVPARAVSQSLAGHRSAATCVAAVERIAAASHWSQRLDTLPRDPLSPLPDAAVKAGEACLVRFAPSGAASVAPDQVEALFLLARATGRHALADTLFERAMGRQRSRADSVELLWHAVSAWALGAPGDLARSQRTAVRLDRLGVRGERIMWPHEDRWESQHDAPRHLAHALLDTAALRVELTREMANLEALPDTARYGTKSSAVGSASLELLLTLLANPRADSAVTAMAARATEILGPTGEGEWGGGFRLIGKRFGPIEPDFWCNRPAGGGAMPRPGRVTLVQYVDPQHCPCGALYTTIRRMKQRFGDAVDFLLLTQSHRHFDRQVGLEPAHEAKLVSERLLGAEKLDVAIAFWTTPYRRHPAPDRRIVPERIKGIHDLRFGTGAMVVDRRGVTMSAGIVSISPWGERVLVRLLESLLSVPAM